MTYIIRKSLIYGTSQIFHEPRNFQSFGVTYNFHYFVLFYFENFFVFGRVTSTCSKYEEIFDSLDNYGLIFFTSWQKKEIQISWSLEVIDSFSYIRIFQR